MAKITIGCDPEYGFLDSRGRLVSPGSVISDHLEGDGFGIDGSSRVAELRPAAADTPQGLVKNIRELIQKGIEANPETTKYKWKAGSIVGEEPVGGHIHFGHAKLLNTTVQRTMGRVLTRVVAPLALMVEDRTEAVDRRVGTSYGAASGDNCYRPQPWGMEYRTLCSWLMGPREAESILALGFVVASQCDNQEWLDLALTLPEVDPEHFADCDKKIISFNLQMIARVLKKASNFKEYRSAMQYLFDTIISGKTFDHDQDMRKSWGLKYKVKDAVNV